MAASPSSSSITNDGYEYDVFLNFRGPDTRRDFTGNIWNALHNRGIRTFRDDLEIDKGINIEKSLSEAIEKSKAAIVVLSPNYATSSFCLDELCHILKCIKGRGRFVWPIFYEVDPSKVRWLEDTYGEAMAEHKKNDWYSEDELKEWKDALKQVAYLSGTVYKWKTGHGYEYELINKIVRDVSRVIQPSSLSIPNYIVGLEAQKQHVLSLLNVGFDDNVYMVGIHGIGGIGKTTLAQVVYNSIVDQFDGSCYLEDVRGNHEKNGLIHLQNTLLSEIFGKNQIVVTSYNKGIKELGGRLKQKKVLLLLDNVDKLDQLRAIVGEPAWFCCGSRVIITTRDTEMLKNHRVERTYEVKELEKKDARDYLRWTTLKSNKVSPSQEAVFNRALTHTGGHPLAIETMGSNLFKNKEEEWNSVLDRYKDIPKKEIFENLKVSFDGLEKEEQAVFLDIACFFKGFKLEEVEKKLHAHYGREKKDLINVLIGKSLIKISQYNVLTLHDEIEDMGKKIVRLESPDHPGERSRLWSVKDIVEVLEENTGTSKIGIMMCSFSVDDIVVNWDGEAFKNMTNLRTLVIESVSFSESPKHLPNSLRVLYFWKYPSVCFPVDFYPKQLTICNFDFRFKCSQEVFFKKYFKNMRRLQFHYCLSLRSIPDVSGLQNLEEFSCSNCFELITFDDSIGMLGKLQHLFVGNCSKLQTIPSLKLPSLENLSLYHLSSIESLSPMLDESLDKLKSLKVVGCEKLQTIPSLKLPSLENLSLHRLSSIESLSPMLDESLDKLKSLEVDGCEKLQTIPSLKLPSLEELTLSKSYSIKSLSPMLDESLDKLKSLEVYGCSDLIYIPPLKLPSLENLSLNGSSSIESLSPMLNESLDKLISLTVNWCEHLKYIPLLKLASLENLTLGHLSSFESLSPMLDVSLNKLQILRVYSCPKIETIPPFKLVSLEKLTLSGLHSIKSLSPMLDESLDKLKILEVKSFKHLIYIPPLKLTSLEKLTLSELHSIKSLSPMLDESLDKLKSLEVVECDKLQTIPSLKLPSLEKLTLSKLHSIKSLSPMLDESLDKLKSLKVYKCSDLICIPPLKLPSLEELELSYLSSFESLYPMLDVSLNKLKILDIECCPKIETSPPLRLPSLEYFYLLQLNSIKSLSPMLDESLDKLKKLSIRGCRELLSFPPVMLPSLEELNLSYCECLESFPSMTSRSMTKLKILRLKDCKKLRNIPAINVDSLVEFDHSGCESLEFSTSWKILM